MEHYSNFTVKNPQNVGGHIAYEVKGEDKTGKFEGLRRYNEFYALREKLTARWPGIYIPMIPPKKAIVRKVFLSVLGK